MSINDRDATRNVLESDKKYHPKRFVSYIVNKNKLFVE